MLILVAAASEYVTPGLTRIMILLTLSKILKKSLEGNNKFGVFLTKITLSFLQRHEMVKVLELLPICDEETYWGIELTLFAHEGGKAQ